MKLKPKIIFLLIIAQLVLFASVCPGNELPFKAGETIRFQIKVFGIHVGYQDMTFTGLVPLNGKKVLHAVADTRSLDFIKTTFNYSLHDVIQVWMDPVSLLPIRVEKDIQEGNWKDHVVIELDQENQNAMFYNKKNPDGIGIRLTKPTLDILSLVYYVRAKPSQAGSYIVADYLVDEKQGVKAAKILVRKAQPLPIGKQNIPTLLFEQIGGQGVKVRMTDDDKRIPISITVGTFDVYGYQIDIVGSLVKIN